MKKTRATTAKAPCVDNLRDSCRADFLQELEHHASVEEGYLRGVKENLGSGIAQLVDEIRQMRVDLNALCQAQHELAGSIKIRFATIDSQIAALQSTKPGNGVSA